MLRSIHLLFALLASACSSRIGNPLLRPTRATAYDDACRLRGGAIERTYAMIKPDVSGNRKAVEEIRKLIAGAGLTIVREERCRLSMAECEQFYAEHRERPFFPSLVKFMRSGKIIKFDLEGEDAVRRWRELLGPTDSEVARQEKPQSVRARYGKDVQRNCAHGSDSLKSAVRELELMFGSAS